MHGRSRVSCKHRQPRCGTCSSSRPGPSCARSRSAMATYTYDVHSLMTISDPTETIQQPWRRVTGTLGVSPRLIPPHSVVKSYTHLASLKYCYITYRIDKTSRGVATPIRDTPRDVLSIRKSNGTLHERSEVVKDFTPKCGGINRGDTPRVPQAPRGVPEVDPGNPCARARTQVFALLYVRRKALIPCAKHSVSVMLVT